MKFFRQNNYTERTNILYFLINLNLVYFLSLVGLWQNHVIYLPLTGHAIRRHDAIYKRGGKQIWVSVSLLSIFFLWNFTHVSKNRWGTLLKRRKNLLFKHEKNNQTLSNDWPTYCHMGIYQIYPALVWSLFKISS